MSDKSKQATENTENENQTSWQEKTGKTPPGETIQEPEQIIEPQAEPTVEEENAKLKDQTLRLAAELENMRRLKKEEVEKAAKFGASNFARDLTSVMDNLHRAIESVPAEKAENDELAKTILQGVEMTRTELTQVFERHGIKRINPMGETFDHNFHQAMIQIPSNEHEPGTIIQVMQAGYALHERLLRPAMVGVAKKAEEE